MRAFHLPALRHLGTADQTFDQNLLTVPLLSPDDVRHQVGDLRTAGQMLAARPAREIVGVIDRVARRFLDPNDPMRREAESLLPGCTGYHPEMIRQGLDRMAEGWLAPALLALLEADLGGAEPLDRFVDVAGRRARAFGRGAAFHLFSGNVPGVAVTSLVRSLLVKTPALGKTASGEPVLPVLFARALAEEDADLGRCVAVTYWPGGTETLEVPALETVDLAVVYGDRDAVDAVASLAPAALPLLVYGPRISFAVVARDEAGEAAAAEAAGAVATFDQQGCVSPHLVYVERGGRNTPRAWAGLLAGALAEAASRIPPGEPTGRDRAAIRRIREEAEFAELGSGEARLWTAPGGEGAGTVIYDPDPAFTASCLNRTVWVKPVDSFDDIPSLVRSAGSLLQTVGVAAPAEIRERLAAGLGAIGVSRVTTLARMAWPPPAWHHDGRPPLGDLVRWCDLEG